MMFFQGDKTKNTGCKHVTSCVSIQMRNNTAASECEATILLLYQLTLRYKAG